MTHDEFPPLTRSGIEVLQRANTANHSSPGGVRPFAAAVIREAVKQAAPFTCVTPGLPVVAVSDLLAIADNLHALPPPPPTQSEMNEALAILMFRTEAGQVDSPLHECVEVLRRGIAHHCKEQP